MLPCKAHEDTTAFIHEAVRGISKLNVLYLSSLDVMLRLKALKESEREALIDHIIHQRVLVADDWSSTYGNIELLKYDFGESNTGFVRGECDASFHELKQIHTGGQALAGITKKGIAKLGFIIWKAKQLLWAEIFENVPCSDSDFAEVLAALALLMKCQQEQFSLVEVWNDNARACGVMTGSQTIKISDHDRYDCLLLRSMHTKFTNLVVVQKPRELMFLSDQLLRMDGYSGCAVKKAIQIWSSSLKGSPLFRITNSKSTHQKIWYVLFSSTPSLPICFPLLLFLIWCLLNLFCVCFSGEKQTKLENTKGFKYSSGSTFYLKVEKENKLMKLQKLRHFLVPSCLHLVMDRFEGKTSILEKGVGRHVS